MEFDLEMPSDWRRLGAAFRVAHAQEVAAIEAQCAIETAAHADAEHLNPSEPGIDRDESMRRSARNREVEARYGLPAADQRVSELGELPDALLAAALCAPAPDRAALGIKLELISDPHGWNDLDSESWLLLLDDLRRVCGLTIHKTRNQQ